MHKIYARIKRKVSFDIYAKFLIFWRCPYENWTTPRGARAKHVKKRVHQRAEIVKIRQFPLQLEQNCKSKFFFSKLPTNVKK